MLQKLFKFQSILGIPVLSECKEEVDRNVMLLKEQHQPPWHAKLQV